MLVSKALNMFQGVHGVERKSVGAFVFPGIIVLIFGLAYGNPLHYSIPIAVLSLSDALAALIGKKYGQNTFHTVGEMRSMEGSTAFLLPTFLIVHIPLLLLTETGREECVLMAVGCAILVTAFEMVSVKGLDNVFIPFGTWYILNNYAQYPLEALSYRIVFMVLIGIYFLFTIRYHIFTRTGAVGGFLWLYAIFSLGEDAFFIPAMSIQLPLILLSLIARIWAKKRPPPMGVSNTFQISLVAVLLLFAYDNLHWEWLIAPFITACAGGVSILVFRLRKHISFYPMLIGLFITLVGPISHLLLQETIQEKDLFLMTAAWICTLITIPIFSYGNRFKAIFICSECQTQTSEKRHCHKPTRLIKGNIFFTETRIGLISIFIGTLVCVGWSAIL